MVAAHVYRVVSAIRPAALPLSANAPAKRHGGAGDVSEPVLWPELQEINAALTEYLAEVTDKVIREEVYKETSDAEEVERAIARSASGEATCLGLSG